MIPLREEIVPDDTNYKFPCFQITKSQLEKNHQKGCIF